MDKKRKQKCRQWFFNGAIAACLACLILTSVGCNTMRKKFIRQKKKDKQEEPFVPVLEPVDYPARILAPEKEYNYYYSMWKVWERDLQETIRDDRNEKKQRYLLEKIIEQLTEMQLLIKEEKQNELGRLVEDYSQLLSEWSKPPQMRNMVSIRNRIASTAKEIRNQFNPEVAKEFLKSQ